MQRILSTSNCPRTSAKPYASRAGFIACRLLKSVAFLILRDAAGLTQVVVNDEATRAHLEALPEETTVSVVGTVTSEAVRTGRGRDPAPRRSPR